MKKIFLGLMLALGMNSVVMAAGAGFPLDKAPDRSNDMAALQNGAKLFVNYCLSCHSASFMRFNRLQDIGLSEKEIADNLLFTTDKVGDTMVAAINPKQAKAWFGANPPDLTLVARSRSSSAGTGADYIYTLLRSYYRDESKPTGWNNLVFPSIGMPHPLWELQGERVPVFETHESHGQTAHVFKEWGAGKAGKMSQEDYDKNVADLVGFLQWMSEPVRSSRTRLGVWVMLFLAGFALVAWRLNASFWKDVK